MVADNNTTPHVVELEALLTQAYATEQRLAQDVADLQEMLLGAEHELTEARLATAGIFAELEAMRTGSDESDSAVDADMTDENPDDPDPTEVSNGPVLSPEGEPSQKLNYDVNWVLHRTLESSIRRKYGQKVIEFQVDTDNNLATVRQPHVVDSSGDKPVYEYVETVIPISNQDVADCLTHILNTRLNIEAQDKDFSMKALFMDGEAMLKQLAKAKVLKLQKGRVEEIIDARFSIEERVVVTQLESASSEQEAS